MTRPTISCVIPAYDNADGLDRALRSVFATSVRPDEVIVVDDASPSDDLAWMTRHHGGSYVRNPQRLWAVANWNKAISLAKGDLVHVLNHDDEVHPHFYEAIGTMACAYPHRALYATRALYAERDLQAQSFTSWVAYLESMPTNLAAFLYANPFETPSVVLRRRFAIDTFGFREDLGYVADWEMWARAVHTLGGIQSSAVLATYYIGHAKENKWNLVHRPETEKEFALLAEMLSQWCKEFDRETFDERMRFHLGVIRGAKARAIAVGGH